MGPALHPAAAARDTLLSMSPTATAPSLALSRRVSALQPSVTIAFGAKARALKQAGVKVLGFTLGEPDFDTPDRIKEAAIAALRAGQTKYMPTFGDPETRTVIADKLTSENGIAGITADHVGISVGGKHVLYNAAQALLDPPVDGAEHDAREAIIPTPAWVSYDPIVRLAGGEVVEVETTPESGFRMSPEQLERAITPNTRLIFMNSPSNPCGTMYTPDELRALAAVIAEKARTTAPSLVVITDEIYEKIVYGGIDHFSLGSVPEIADRVLTVNGLSKAFSMTGWRVGYCAMPGEFGKRLIKGMASLQGQMTTNITSFVYPAIRTALTECADDVERMRVAFAGRAKLIASRLAEIDGLTCPTPTGAFYAFPDVSSYFGRTSPKGAAINSPLELCNALLEEQHVACVPGEDFGGCGRNCIRISFACSEDQINGGMDKLGEFLGSLK